jgi:sugar phosphate isomerase/epimerase
MRLQLPTGRPGFLGYCANVHPGESLADVLRAVGSFGRGVRAALEVPELSLGLWLSRRSLDELLARGGHGVHALRASLRDAGVCVVTLNGFPYGNFHERVVKRTVYHPDLCSPERRSYLAELAGVLSALLPADATEGTISTLPIGHRDEPCDGSEPAERLAVSRAAAAQLCLLSDALARQADTHGKPIRICLEPEPGCWLESTADALRFFGEVLPEVARERGVPRARIEQHFGLCYDTCHQAICFEDPEASIAALTRAGVRIGKAQLSSALQLTQPSDPAALAELLQFQEPRFLHQVRTRDAHGELWAADDLDQLAGLPRDAPWRVHFHVPIHRQVVSRVETTRAFLERALPPLAALDPPPHLEVETYTWSVLPEAERPATDDQLVAGLAREIAFVREVLA